MQPLRCMGQAVAVLVDRAALDRHAAPHRGDCGFMAGRAIDDEEIGPS